MLGMTHSYINVPSDQMKDYAQGYTKQGAPIRLSTGVLSSEAYGIKSSTPDMIRFIAANMQMIKIDSELQRAINDTHTGYFRAGEITQDLIWEQYPYPVALKTLLAGNSDAMAYQAYEGGRNKPSAAAASECADQQDRINQWFCNLRRVCSGSEIRYRHARKQEFSHRSTGDCCVSDIDPAWWSGWSAELIIFCVVRASSFSPVRGKPGGATGSGFCIADDSETASPSTG
jgi:hypothetical protein